MKYIVRYHNTEWDDCPMYMIAVGRWSESFSEASIHNDKDSAINLVNAQYPSPHKAWNGINILEYTDQEYFKVVLKG